MENLEKSDQHFRQSLRAFRKRSSQIQNVYDSARGDKVKSNLKTPGLPITEEEGLKMIDEEDKHEELRKAIESLDEANPTKHVLTLTL